jgi:hypothetical protein
MASTTMPRVSAPAVSNKTTLINLGWLSWTPPGVELDPRRRLFPILGRQAAARRRRERTGDARRSGAAGIIEITPTVQVGSSNSDLNVDGGFKEDLHTTLRVMKLF